MINETEALVTYRTPAMVGPRFDIREAKEALARSDDFKKELTYCSTFFTSRPLFRVGGAINQQQYRRALDGEISLERLTYLGSFQKIKENEEKIHDFSDLGKYNVIDKYLSGGILIDEVEKLCKVVAVESNYDGTSEHKGLAGFLSLSMAAMGTSVIVSSDGDLTMLIFGGLLGLVSTVPTSILLRRGLSKEAAAIRQLKAMVPFYAEQAARDIEALPQNINYLEALCSHVQEAAQDNTTFYPERKLNQEEQKSLVNYVEHDIPEHHIRLLQLQTKISTIQAVCQEKLWSPW